MSKRALAEFAAIPEPESELPPVEPVREPVNLRPVIGNDRDYFVEKDGMRFAGTHLLVELWGARHLKDTDLIEATLRDAAEAAGAIVLHVHLHRFGPSGGVSGVAVLAESHISIHTWPERDYAAVDVFMCGGCAPYRSLPVFKRAFSPTSVQLCEQRRGLLP